MADQFFSACARSVPINSRSIRDAHKDAYNDFFDKYDLVASAPGATMISGEKVVIAGETGTCLLIPRRVYVGMRRVSSRETGLNIERNEVFDESDGESGPMVVGPYSYSYGDRNRIFDALKWAVEYLEIFTDKPIPAFDVGILSEWKGETGLSWSAALASALSSGLLIASNVIDVDSPIWKRPSADHDDCKVALVLGWIIEAALHGGGTGGMTVAAALMGGALPFIYRAKGGMPKLWSIYGDTGMPSEDQFRQSRSDRKRQYSEFARFGDIEIERLGDRDSVQDEIETWTRVFSRAALLIAYTDTPKSTAATSYLEAASGIRRRFPSLYEQCLPQICNEVADSARKIVDSTDDKQLDDAWASIFAAVDAARGIGMALGLSFATADQIFGCLKQYCPGAHGKISGAGTGGNLLIAYRLGDYDHQERMDMIWSAMESIRQHHSDTIGTDLRIGIMYSTHIDGFEKNGVRLEKVIKEIENKARNKELLSKILKAFSFNITIFPGVGLDLRKLLDTFEEEK